MTGAGSAQVAWTPETSYLGGPESTPTYYSFGRNVTADDVQIANNLTLIREPSDPQAKRSLAQNFDGSWAVGFVLKNNNYHDLIFNDDSGGSGTNDSIVNGTWPSAEIYMYTDHIGGELERVLEGAAVRSCDIEYQQGQPVRVTLRGLYGDESSNTSLTAGTREDPGTSVAHHGADLSITGTSVTKLQSATLSIGPLVREIRGTSRHPVAVVNGAVEPTLDFEAVLDDGANLERAYGSAGATGVQDDTDQFASTFSFTDATGSTVAEYSMDLEFDEYGWNSLVAADEDLTDPVTANIHNLSASS